MFFSTLMKATTFGGCFSNNFFMKLWLVRRAEKQQLLGELSRKLLLVQAISASQVFDCCTQTEHSHFIGSCSRFCLTKAYKAETPCTSDWLLCWCSQSNSLTSADIAMRLYNITVSVQMTPHAKNTTNSVHANSTPGILNRHIHNTKHDQHNSHLTPHTTHGKHATACMTMQHNTQQHPPYSSDFNLNIVHNRFVILQTAMEKCCS